MNRRELLKAILPVAAVPVLVKGQEVGKAFKVEPDAKYVVFLNADKVDVQAFAEHERALPGGTVIHSVYLNSGDTMDEVVRIYKVEG